MKETSPLTKASKDKLLEVYDSLIADICAVFHIRFSDIFNEDGQVMPDWELDWYIDHLEEQRNKNNLQVAQLAATILNALGGKGDGTGKITPEHKLFKANELLVNWQADGKSHDKLTARAIADLKANKEFVPSWAFDLIPWKLTD